MIAQHLKALREQLQALMQYSRAHAGARHQPASALPADLQCPLSSLKGETLEDYIESVQAELLRLHIALAELRGSADRALDLMAPSPASALMEWRPVSRAESVSARR